MSPAFISSAPGRLCLFGEHQDYLGLPVIAMAVNRRCHLHFNPSPGNGVKVTSAQFGEVDAFEFNRLDPGERKSPLRHALAALIAEFQGKTPGGWHIHIESEIPVRSGCSSSTALMTAWIAGWLEAISPMRRGFSRVDSHSLWLTSTGLTSMSWRLASCTSWEGE